MCPAEWRQNKSPQQIKYEGYGPETVRDVKPVKAIEEPSVTNDRRMAMIVVTPIA